MTKVLSLLATILIVSGCQKSNPNELVAPVKYKGKYGFIDTKGNWVIKARFDSVGIFYNGFATVFKNKKEGKINAEGGLIIKYKFDFIGHFEDGLALVVIGDSVNYIDTVGNLVSERFYFDGEGFSEGLAPVQLEENSKWGYINKSGEIKIAPTFDYAQEFKNGRASVDLGEYELLVNKMGLITDTVEFDFLKRKFPIIGSANNSTLGKLNSRGDTIMHMKYRSFGYPQGDLMWYFTGEKYGLADTTGTILIKPIYDKLGYFSNNGLALAMKGGRYGFIDSKGATQIPFIFRNTNGFKYDLAAVQLNEKWGFINGNGDFVIEPKFDSVLHFFRPISAKYEPQYKFERE